MFSSCLIYIDLQFHKCNSPALIASRCMQLLGKCLHTTVAPPPLSPRPMSFRFCSPPIHVCTHVQCVYTWNFCIHLRSLHYSAFDIPVNQPTSLYFLQEDFYFSVESLSCHHCLLHPFQQVIKILIAAIHLQDDPTHRFEALICHSNSVVLWLQHAHLIAPRSSWIKLSMVNNV